MIFRMILITNHHHHHYMSLWWAPKKAAEASLWGRGEFPLLKPRRAVDRDHSPSWKSSRRQVLSPGSWSSLLAGAAVPRVGFFFFFFRSWPLLSVAVGEGGGFAGAQRSLARLLRDAFPQCRAAGHSSGVWMGIPSKVSTGFPSRELLHSCLGGREAGRLPGMRVRLLCWPVWAQLHRPPDPLQQSIK